MVTHKGADLDTTEKQESIMVLAMTVWSLTKGMFSFSTALVRSLPCSLLMTILLTQERFPLLATCYQPAYNKSIQSAFESIFYKTIPKWSITSILSCIRLELKKFNPSIGFCVQISAVKKSRESC